MAVLEIPVRSDLDAYSLIITLEETDYRLTFRHNTRDDHWYMSVELTDGTALASGIPVVVDTPLLARWSWDDRLPQDGFIMAVDSTGEAEEPAKEDFGDRVKLLYVPLEDIP